MARVCADAAGTADGGRGATMDVGTLGEDFLLRDALGSAKGFSKKIASRKITTDKEIEILRRVTFNLCEDIFDLRL